MTDYALHVISRNKAHRTERATLPMHMRKLQFVGVDQLRLVPGRRLIISEDQLQRNLEDIRLRAKSHSLEVRTLDGRLVDVETLKAGPAAPAEPRPNFLPDSVANDRNKGIGQYIPPYVGEDTAMPQVMPPGEKPDLVKQAGVDYAQETEEAPAQERPTTPPPPHPPAASTVDAAVDAAQAAAIDEDGSASDAVSSGEGKKGKKGRR